MKENPTEPARAARGRLWQARLRHCGGFPGVPRSGEKTEKHCLDGYIHIALCVYVYSIFF